MVLCCLITKSGDWTIRIDSPHGPKDYHRKHVHVSKRGLDGEYSWNIDGTRHDKRRFPSSEKCISAAKQHAASALGIPAGALQLMVAERGGARISIRPTLDPTKRIRPVLSMYLPVRRSMVILGSPNGLVLVIEEEA